jgi:hypothetical protein
VKELLQLFRFNRRDVVACSPTSVWRSTTPACWPRANRIPSRKRTGFAQPLKPHQHWHVDVSYLNFADIQRPLRLQPLHCTLEIRATINEGEIDTILQRALADFLATTTVHAVEIPVTNT